MDLDDIVARLAELEEADPEQRIFDLGDHCHRLNPPVAAKTLSRAEDLIGEPLPEEYRSFLTTAGDGGAGPYYGLEPLAHALELVDVLWGTATLGRPSPFRSDVDFGELLGMPDDWDEHAARLGTDAEYAAGWDRLKTIHMAEPWTDGRLPLADFGCGDRLYLIVNGPRRGTVIADCLDTATGLYDLRVDFLTWYTRWLDDALACARGELVPTNAHFPVLQYGDNPRYDPVP